MRMDRGREDGQPIEHAFEDDHAEGFIAAWHDEHIGSAVPAAT